MGILVRLLTDLDRRRRHRGAARAVRNLLPEPESWLDVATGDAAFPETARRLFPYTSFDGTDPTPRVAHAQAEEKVEMAYVGPLTHPHIATAVRSRYDVVTLLHTPASREELRTAVTALRPSGLLLVETPCANALRTELESQGCQILSSKTRRLVARRVPATPR
ncbi:methyltransferase domain-containing protein [Streptomyces gilvus]|uniref:methyltransferase domain-containing protein n=1 Tax=Streptomyces gilvus TaxID=2920937 RepID=UPI001F0EFF3F|nr:methyltransferase domain-containing protein [Streptomyces sp. CME 23]MCH5677778.1 class I SAM-dependent methyltransferase [Streptomyces sp. CME 23]